MGGVSAIVRCPHCGSLTAEVCYTIENWDGFNRVCYACEWQGLSVIAVPTTREWTPDPESIPDDEQDQG